MRKVGDGPCPEQFVSVGRTGERTGEDEGGRCAVAEDSVRAVKCVTSAEERMGWALPGLSSASWGSHCSPGPWSQQVE